MFDNMYEVRIANSGDVAGFPRSHDGLEKAIILASREGTEVTFEGETIWSPEAYVADYQRLTVWPTARAAKSLITNDLQNEKKVKIIALYC